MEHLDKDSIENQEFFARFELCAGVVGFEPPEDISTPTHFRGAYLLPLRHTTKD